ncbi:hypothetical protein HOY82DRAFT_486892 [Tuber indicum]|nr:hypothetical protein HOY82DRAFT_486892 [Tuber indicum]
MAVMSPQLSVNTQSSELKSEAAAPVLASVADGSAASEGAMAMDLDLNGSIKQDDSTSPQFAPSSPKDDHVSNGLRTPFVNGSAPDAKINAPPSPPIPTPPLHSDNTHDLSDLHITSPAGLPGSTVMSFQEAVGSGRLAGEPMDQGVSGGNVNDDEKSNEGKDIGSDRSEPPQKSEPSGSMADSSHDAAADRTMTDAPTFKASRSRDDDDGEGPPLKRAKTEEEMDVVSPTTAASYNSTAPLTATQIKYLLVVIRSLRRTKDARPFTMPVDPIKLNVPNYFEVITNPMDLQTMEKKLNNKEYSSSRDFLADFNLILTNCVTFNGREHPVSENGRVMKAVFEKHMAGFPSADFVEPQKSKSTKKKGGGNTTVNTAAPKPPKPVAPVPQAIKATQTKKESKRPVPTAAITAASPTFGLQPSGIPQIRRDSTANDRPKREIHPPAPKDLPYSDVKPRRKKAASELRFCDIVLKELHKKQYHDTAFPFYVPVDPVALNIPDYFKIIKKPMDLSTISTKLKTNQYDSASDFEADIRLMFSNCYKFNPSDQHVHKCGKALENIFDQKWAEKASYTRDNPGSHSPVSVSPPVEDEDEDMSGDESEDQEQNIRLLEQQLEAMKDQISAMKNGQKKKKTPPATSTKRSKGGSSRKGSLVSTAPPANPSRPKKGKKEKKVPYITMEQKTELSERINFLPTGKMAYALKMIRENMPDLGNTADDEIELDIDELDPQTLYKLHTYVTRHAEKKPSGYVPPPPPPAPVTEPKSKSKSLPKSKKNKPMSAVEQEAKIKDLQAKLQNFDNPTPQPSNSAAHGDDSDSSDDDDESSGSESEEE